ncbi:hypothetical protein ACETK8_12125 [Brevundimonas staleyi]|uniref:Uncharacterized protein n=1 Tax=Brevundimonas staleyi TaxID=74326 RepID=A0ABW0FT71_9CAUL
MPVRLAALAACALLAAGCSPRDDGIDPSGAEEVPADIQPQALTAEHLANLIAADGARHTVLVLTGPADPTGFDKVLAGIATGAPEWLALVPQLQPATDGLHAEGLQDALATALTRNAPGVLALIPDHAHPLFVCAATHPPDARMIAARAAVEAVTDPALQAAKAECLRAFDGKAE